MNDLICDLIKIIFDLFLTRISIHGFLLRKRLVSECLFEVVDFFIGWVSRDHCHRSAIIASEFFIRLTDQNLGFFVVIRLNVHDFHDEWATSYSSTQYSSSAVNKSLS